MNDFDDKNDETKRKSRNLSEKKRRDQFNRLVTELGTMVSPNNRKMDKTTVLKTTISFLQQHNQTSLKSQIHEIQDNWKPSFLSNEEYIHLMLEALEGFILIVGVDGRVIFASENITAMLGYLSRDLTSMSIFDLIEEGDKGHFCDFLANPTTSLLNQDPVDLSINVHMKKVGHKNKKSMSNNNNNNGNGGGGSGGSGGSVNAEHPSESQYELVKLCGHFRRWQGGGNSQQQQQQQQHGNQDQQQQQQQGFDPYGSDDESISTQSEYSRMSMHDVQQEKTVFICTVHLQTSQLIREIPLQQPGKTEFTSRYSLEFKFLSLDQRAPAIIGYLPFELLGTSGYEYYHMDDLDHLTTCHEALMKTGEGTTSFYRFLSKGQQWIWLQTRYYITYHQWNAKPEFVMATHKVMNYQDVLKDMKHELATTDQGVSGGERGGGGGGTESEIDSMEMKSRAESPTWSSRSSIGCSSGTSTRHSQDLGAKMNIEMYPLDMEKQHQVQFQHHQLFPPYKTEEDTEDNVSNSSRQDSANSFMPTSSVGTVAIPATAVTAVSTARAAAAVVPSSAAAAAAVVVAAGMSVASPASPLPVVGPVSNVVSAASPGQLPVLMSPVQMQLQAQLRMKHNELAKRMATQQEELRKISEHLLMSQYGLVPVSVAYNPTSLPAVAAAAAANPAISCDSPSPAAAAIVTAAAAAAATPSSPAVAVPALVAAQQFHRPRQQQVVYTSVTSSVKGENSN